MSKGEITANTYKTEREKGKHKAALSLFFDLCPVRINLEIGVEG